MEHSMVAEITVTVRNEEKVLKSKHLIYDTFTTADCDPVLKECIDKAVKEFQSTPDSVKVRINLLPA
jgi:hypothetical protein